MMNQTKTAQLYLLTALLTAAPALASQDPAALGSHQNTNDRVRSNPKFGNLQIDADLANRCNPYVPKTQKKPREQRGSDFFNPSKFTFLHGFLFAGLAVVSFIAQCKMNAFLLKR